MPFAPLEFPLPHLFLIKPDVLFKALLKYHLFYGILFRCLCWKHYPRPLFLCWTFFLCYSIYDSIFHIRILCAWVWLHDILNLWRARPDFITQVRWGWGCSGNYADFIMRYTWVRTLNLILRSCELGKVIQCLQVLSLICEMGKLWPPRGINLCWHLLCTRCFDCY